MSEPVTAREAIVLAAPLLVGGPVVLVSDFDGTLAHLSSDPWGASMLRAARRALRRLGADPRVSVVFLSGRGVSDLAGRVRVGGATYLGDHGAERAYLPRRFRALPEHGERSPASPEEMAAAEALAHGVPVEVPDDWLVVERKFPAVCFHFRAAPDVDEARRRVGLAVDRLDGRGALARIQGRRSLELRPHGSTTKADAMRDLLERHPTAAFLALGDDRHDAAAFAVLRHEREAGRARGLSIAVLSHPEWAHEVLPHADLALADAGQAARFLAGLSRAFAGESGKRRGRPEP